MGILALIGVFLQFLGCALYNTWWPLLSAFTYVLVPQPYLFFGNQQQDSFSAPSGWVDVGKFMVGFSAVFLLAIPAVLYHSQVITFGALIIETLAALFILASVVVYDYGTSQAE